MLTHVVWTSENLDKMGLFSWQLFCSKGRNQSINQLTLSIYTKNGIRVSKMAKKKTHIPLKSLENGPDFRKKAQKQRQVSHTVEYQHHLHIQVPWVSDRQHQSLPTLDFSHCCTLHSEFCIFEQLFKEPSKTTMCFKGWIILKYPLGAFVSTKKPMKFV